MSEKSKTRCKTQKCIDHIQRYGERCHFVYDRENGTECDGCGASLVNGAWKSECRMCGVEVENGFLVGLFVPTMCYRCENIRADTQIATGKVCSMCRKPYVRCCC